MVTAILNALHVVAAIVWVGGMFFAHMALRPAVLPMAPKERLELWSRVFPRFFTWVWVAIVTLLVSGFGLIATVFGGMAGAPLPVHLMTGMGLIMMTLYVGLFTIPYRRFRAALAAGDLPAAAAQQGRIRQIVGINLTLGLLTAIVAAAGRHGL